jgi:TatD DNase family protein
MIDVHAHLANAQFTDLEAVLGRAKGAGVDKIIISITDPDELSLAEEIVSANTCLYLTVGFDPVILSETKFNQFQRIASTHKAVGIGEVGLDHFYVREHGQRALQENFFRQSIRLSLARGLPLVVHSRSAGRLALEVLQSEGAKNVLMHAFDGKAGDALAFSKLGYKFSIPTSVVQSEQKQKLVKLLPLESLMLETDSPVLAPVRGERNEPANLIFSARAISEIKKIPLGVVMETTTRSAEGLFGI